MAEETRAAWETLPPDRLAQTEEKLRDLEERLNRQRSDFELTALVLGLMASTDVADDARLVASQIGHLATRLTDVRADMRARLRSGA